VTVRVEPHRFFKRKGNDVHCDVELNIRQVVLGSTVRVKTADGRRVQLKIPPETQDGSVFRLPRMGFGKNGQKADQYVTVHLKIPDHLTDEEKELMKRFVQKGKTKH